MSLNPLFWLHLRISGSARTNLIIVVAYVAIVIMFTGGSYYVAAAEAGAKVGPQTYARVDAAWLVIMTVAQGAFLLLLAPSAIRRAVQRDFDSGMIESHRLSPMSNLKIVLGYMSGAPIQAMMLYAVSLLFGTYFATRYALSPGLGGTIGLRTTLSGWYFAQGCMLVVAAMIGAFTLLTSLATRGKGNIIGVAILIGVFGGWAAIFVIPGLALLAGVLSGWILIGLLTSAKVGGDPRIIVVSTLLQVVFCVIMLAAACGKLRSPNRAVFTIELGLILLIVWGVTLAMGIFVAPAYGSLFSEWQHQALAQLVASTVAFMLVALLPLIGATVELCQRDRAAAFGEDRSVRRCAELTFVPLMLGLMTATCCLIMSPVWAATEQLGHVPPNALIRQIFVPIAVAMLCSFWIDFNWIYHLAAHGRRIMIGLPIMFVLVKGMPILLDNVIDYFGQQLADLEWAGYGYLTGLSPVGTLILAPEGGALIWVGLVFQVVLAIGATVVARRARRRLGRRAEETSIPHDVPTAVPSP
jgi:hypothetical protein